MVFTSAGDNTSFPDIWCSSNQNYDLYIVYYGDNEETYYTYSKVATWIDRRKGSKFQNFYWMIICHPEFLDQYDYFFILDDDIIISAESISKMFTIADHFHLSICQPSLSEDSIITYPHLVHSNKILLRYTNFVEVNAPLFSKEALIQLLKVYEPCLIGWGVDYLAIFANGIERKDAYAVIHYITCRNPHLHEKKQEVRELYKIEKASERAFVWKEFASRNGYPQLIQPEEYAGFELV